MKDFLVRLPDELEGDASHVRDKCDAEQAAEDFVDNNLGDLDYPDAQELLVAESATDDDGNPTWIAAGPWQRYVVYMEMEPTFRAELLP